MVLLFTCVVEAKNKPVSELVWEEAEEEGCINRVCFSDVRSSNDKYLEQRDRRLFKDPYSEHDRDSNEESHRADFLINLD